MVWVIRTLPKRTYYCVGWTARDPKVGAFREVALPGGSIMRVMDKGVHQAALERVGERLVEIERQAARTPYD
jgi:hypothetical protein